MSRPTLTALTPKTVRSTGILPKPIPHPHRRPPAVKPLNPEFSFFSDEPLIEIPRHRLYRAYLQHLRLIPDPHVWNIMQPRMRGLCAWPVGSSDSGQITRREMENELSLESWDGEDHNLEIADENGAGPSGWNGADKHPRDLMMNADPGHRRERMERRRIVTLRRARKELKMLRAAVACHPHAFYRLLENAYGQKGVTRWKLIQRMIESSPSPPDHPKSHLLTPTRPDLPTVLKPLKPPPIPPTSASPRARTYIPPNAGKRKAIQHWHRDWDRVGVPIVLPRLPKGMSPSPETGWEGKGVMEGLRMFVGEYHPSPLGEASTTAGMNTERGGQGEEKGGEEEINYLGPRFPPPQVIPTFQNLPKHIQRLLPRNLLPRLRELEYPKPLKYMTKSQPGRWGNPVQLDARLVQRMYRRFWDGLVWVRPDLGGGPEKVGSGVGVESRTVRWLSCGFGEMRKYMERERFGGIGEVEKDQEHGIGTGKGQLKGTDGKKGDVKGKGKVRGKGKVDEEIDRVRWSLVGEEEKKWFI